MSVMKHSIGDFLLRRLEEAGIRHIFGVPGDYNLELMQQLEERGAPAWVGNCNELNASYATDAYARINGIGAMIVTHGVGALSAINGIAGAYSEHVPVICISGSIPLRAIQRGDLMHHTLADREKGDFCRMFAEVTAAQARLTQENAVAEVDRLILTAWRRKLPVYLELPSDISYLEIEVPDRPIRLEMIPSDPDNLKACTGMILERLSAAKSPAFLLDLDASRFGVSGPIMELAERYPMRVATLNCAKGTVPETSTRFAGTYAGIGSSPATREAIEGSDCLLTIGYRRIESTTGFFTDKLPASAINLNSSYVDTADKNYQAVYIAELLQSIVAVFEHPPEETAGSSVEAVVLRAIGRSPHPRRILEGDAESPASRRCHRCRRRHIERRFRSPDAARGLHPYLGGLRLVFDRLCNRGAARSHSRFPGAASHPAHWRGISSNDGPRDLDRHAARSEAADFREPEPGIHRRESRSG